MIIAAVNSPMTIIHLIELTDTLALNEIHHPDPTCIHSIRIKIDDTCNVAISHEA